MMFPSSWDWLPDGTNREIAYPAFLQMSVTELISKTCSVSNIWWPTIKHGEPDLAT
jgi:hypothetical protein